MFMVISFQTHKQKIKQTNKQARQQGRKNTKKKQKEANNYINYPPILRILGFFFPLL